MDVSSIEGGLIEGGLIKAGIRISEAWADIHMSDFEIMTSDGKSLFTHRVYVDPATLFYVVENLTQFSTKMESGSSHRIEFGKFGSDFGGGAFSVYFQIQKLGKIHIVVRGQSRYLQFGSQEVANEATLHLVSEPALLDSFINDLRGVERKLRSEAFLECITGLW